MTRLLSMICSAAAMLAVSSNVFAQTTTTTMTTSTTPAKKTVFFEQGMPLVDSADGKYKADPVPYTGQYNPGYAAAAGTRVDGMDINVNASFIYWYFSQDAMDLAFTAPDTLAPVSAGAVVTQDFAYKPGFKVGLGYDTQYDNWAVNADYTWFHAKKSTSATSTVGFDGSAFFPVEPTLTASTVDSTWKLHMDMIDVVASRPFYQSTHITVAPSGGVRALFLRQAVNVALDANTSNTTSHSWALGPKGAVNTKWNICHGLRIDSVVGSSLLYTRYTNVTNTLHVGANTVTSKETNVSALRPTMDMGLGLGYGAYMMKNKLFLDVSARYDFAQYWSQNMVRNFVSNLNGASDNGDLAMSGLTVNVRCDF